MKKKCLFAIIAASLPLLLGLHPLDMDYISWFAFLPMFFLLYDPNCRARYFVLSVLCIGVLYFGLGLYWLLYFDVRIYVVAFLVIAPIYAIYFGVLRGLFSKSKNTDLIILTAPCLWLLLNQVFALSPLGTIAIEVPFYGALPFFQLASVTGLAVVPAAILGMNAALAALLKKRSLSHGVWLVFFLLGYWPGCISGVKRD